MADDEMAEIGRSIVATILAMVQVAQTLAALAVRQSSAHLRQAAAGSRHQQVQARARIAAWRRADAAVWRPATRRGWWRTASPEEIGRAWRAATVWHAVDPDAAEARRYMTRRLAERGVTLDPVRMDRGDLLWLRAAMDAARTDQARDRGRRPGRRQQDGPQQEQEADEQRFVHTAADQQRMAELVRRTWEADEAEKVLSSAGWAAMAYRMHEHQRAGGDLEQLLPDLDLSGARDPGALGAWRIERATRLLADHGPGAQQDGQERTGERAGDRSGSRRRGTAPAADADPVRAAAMSWYEDVAAAYQQGVDEHVRRGSDARVDRWRRDRALTARDQVATTDDPAEWVRHQAREVEFRRGGVANPTSRAEAAGLRSLLNPPSAEQVPPALATIDRHFAEMGRLTTRADRSGDPAGRDVYGRQYQATRELRHRITTADDPARQLWLEASRPGLMGRTGLSAEQLRPAPEPAQQQGPGPSAARAESPTARRRRERAAAAQASTPRSASSRAGQAWPMPTRHALAAAIEPRRGSERPAAGRPHRSTPGRDERGAR